MTEGEKLRLLELASRVTLPIVGMAMILGWMFLLSRGHRQKQAEQPPRVIHVRDERPTEDTNVISYTLTIE